MTQSKQCPSCGSTNIYQESATVYRCSDCFDKLPSGAIYDTPPPKVYGTQKNSDPNQFTKYKYIILSVVIGWMILGSTFTALFQNITTTSTQVDESQNTIIDPNNNLSEIHPEGDFYYTNELPDSIGNSYFVGTFTNTSGSDLLMPKFTVTLFNEDGSSIGSSDGYGEKNLITNNESVIFEVLWSKIPKYHHYEISVTATTNEGDLNRPDLVLKSIELKKIKNKGTMLTGKIQNQGTTIANFTRIKCLIIGSDNLVSDYGTIVLEKEDFLPKETQKFSFEFYRTNEFPTLYYCETDGMNKETNTN
ncbi:hypothetical protein [Leptospira levettii]|uniref:Uncharacterized protein n=1 Tax=Leptospira levettii TaxID=2023178 RepID=A0AAW5VAP5_9LEPT|nr:hypothetical protein [Leptospira levettii]MCW7466762.1 hypothetical protein [Leptospira levettii]MCW7512485.1 hypothetical protein [Leptospira levettii]MCW7515919.1 hypothetical protein [Leptospira levettii]